VLQHIQASRSHAELAAMQGYGGVALLLGLTRLVTWL
jgi:hypothetical protein